MKKKAVVHLWGGIGNQLFIYSFGEYLRNRYKLDVYYDLSSYGTTEIRNIEINAITDHLPEYKTKWYFFTRHTGVFRRVSRALFQALPGVYYTNNVYDENILSKNYRLIYFDGYWQDRRYAEWIRKNDPDFYTIKRPIPEKIQCYSKKIGNNEYTSIHIRRGDYLLPQNAVFQVCTIDYYEKAIKSAEKIGLKKFVVFSDDMGWVKANLKLPDAIYVENKKGSPIWDIYLMTLCSNNIISNSTFSWWGAFLNLDTNKIVFAPKRWFKIGTSPDLYYSDWQLIEV